MALRCEFMRLGHLPFPESIKAQGKVETRMLNGESWVSLPVPDPMIIS